MWLHFSGGRFVSIVAVHPMDPMFLTTGRTRNHSDCHLLVRARLAGDIEKFLDIDGRGRLQIHRDDKGTRDYRYRAYVPRDRVKGIVAMLAACITYTNFKGTINALDRHRTRWHDKAWTVAINAQEDAMDDDALRPALPIVPLPPAAPRKARAKPRPARRGARPTKRAGR
jgi:hypothetical protein